MISNHQNFYLLIGFSKTIWRHTVHVVLELKDIYNLPQKLREFHAVTWFIVPTLADF